MTTATKPKTPRSSAGLEPIEDMIGRENDRRSLRLAAFERLKDTIVADVDDLSIAHLHLTANQLHAFADFGFTSTAEVVRELETHRACHEARELAGDPATLEAARAAEAVAIEAEQTARAEAADLDAPSDGEPMLAKQIRALQTRLTTLTTARQAATAKVAALENRRKWLRDHAPKQLRDAAERELTRTKIGSPTWRRLCALRVEISTLQNVSDRWALIEAWSADGNQGNKFEKDPLLATHAKAHLPNAYSHNNGTPSFDRHKFAEYVKTMRAEMLPPLLAEQSKLQAEWQVTVDGIQSQLDHWILTGEVLR